MTQPAIIASVIVSGLLIGFQELGVLEPLELQAFDQMMQRRPDLGKDNRILIVAFTENDIQKLKQSSPNGATLEKVLTKLERYRPKAIGLDFFRDVPVEPGHQKLLTHIKKSETIIPLCRVGGDKIPAVPPPTGIDPQIAGFADIPEDGDVVIRRNLLVVSPDPKSSCTTPASLGFQLALTYLNTQPQFTPDGNLILGKKLFKPLESNSGGYHKIDAKGFQILLNYRSEKNVAQEVSLTDVLSDRVPSNLVKNRVVLIGSTAPSSQDIRNTPYSDGRVDNSGKMPGVMIHAQMVSQILDAVSDKRPLFWFFPQWGEILWIWCWTLVGGIIASLIQHPLRLGLNIAGVFTALLLSNFVFFLYAGWIPVVSPALGLLLGAGVVLAYIRYDNQRQKEKIAVQIKEQNETISLLQLMLREGGNSTTEVPTAIFDGSQPEKLLNKRYKLAELLGSGGFSYTYRAEDTYRPGNPVCVVKHLQPARKDEGFLEVARRLFKTEAEILQLLGEHDQIPLLMAYFEENKQFYLVQEYVPGHSLQVELSTGKPCTQLHVIAFLKDVLSILAFVHSQGVIHRDIKPSNLMRRATDQRIVLIDFGAVKQLQPQQQQESHTVAVGTVGYSPPEQFMGQPRLNSDIYALGMVAIQALTATPPTAIQRDETTAAMWRHLAKVTDKFAAILDKMVAFDFQKRYQTAEEVLQSLNTL
ncbi:CHASE2 domain-containing serine/threonine-protein kinase [Aetokthonos hydrillicola]|uniref:CHASE2 domain-containing serine/threonine-protein kinase n=1 Tax=Aetokthonos hydrillicola TaxID=1550245 RepID=UPI001FBB7DAA|nr:CHASE2 domain-containing serine/threonine-protein kinase [Aetokthonos hydrillicola]